jgi:membrane protease subunit HflC
MNAAAIRTVGVAVAAVAVVLLLASTFVVQQTQTALVLRFGAVQQATSRSAAQAGLGPGLHFKCRSSTMSSCSTGAFSTWTCRLRK